MDHFQGNVIVGLNTDDFVESYKGHKPINPYEERKFVLEGCRYVTGVVENVGGADSKPAILQVNPDVVAIGSDWFGRDYLGQMQFDWEWLHQYNIALAFIPRVTPVSTTDIKRRLLADDSDNGCQSDTCCPSPGYLDPNASVSLSDANYHH